MMPTIVAATLGDASPTKRGLAHTAGHPYLNHWPPRSPPRPLIPPSSPPWVIPPSSPSSPPPVYCDDDPSYFDTHYCHEWMGYNCTALSCSESSRLLECYRQRQRLKSCPVSCGTASAGCPPRPPWPPTYPPSRPPPPPPPPRPVLREAVDGNRAVGIFITFLVALYFVCCGWVCCKRW